MALCVYVISWLTLDVVEVRVHMRGWVKITRTCTCCVQRRNVLKVLRWKSWSYHGPHNMHTYFLFSLRACVCSLCVPVIRVKWAAVSDMLLFCVHVYWRGLLNRILRIVGCSRRYGRRFCKKCVGSRTVVFRIYFRIQLIVSSKNVDFYLLLVYGLLKESTKQ